MILKLLQDSNLDHNYNEKARIEAALYSSGRSLSPRELAKAAGITSSRRAILHARLLVQKSKECLDAVEIIEHDDGKFIMQLKPEFYYVATKFATKPLLSKGALKTLSHIAYFQPISSSQLSRKLGARVYHYLKRIEKLGLIHYTRNNRTKLYTTTSSFSDYFGLNNGSREELHKYLAQRLSKDTGAK